MLKSILIALLFVTTSPSFSEQIHIQVQVQVEEDDDLFFSHYINGYVSLVTKNYFFALDHFDKAFSCVHSEDSLENLFVQFGRIIAYDNLGLQERCQNAIETLSRLMDDESEENDDDLESEETEDLTLEEYQAWALWLHCLKNLSLQTPTPAVREFLLSLVKEMMQELNIHYENSF
ncbi:MAG: hypothetical protein V4494_07855 [Chlamydiota bacterium]